MGSEKTVLNPFVIVKPKNILSAYRIWASLPPYRLRSVINCKPVFLKKESIQSSQINKSIWTIMTANDDYDEIVIYAHQDEVEGGFEKQGPAPTPWFKLLKGYIFRSPSLWTTFLLAVILFFSLKYSGYFKSEQFLNEYPFYQQYPKEFLSLVKTRIIFWSVLVPAALVPLLTALFGLSGLWPSKIGRIQATVKVESWIMLFIALYLITQMPLAKLLHNSDIFFMNLNNPKIQQYLKGK